MEIPIELDNIELCLLAGGGLEAGQVAEFGDDGDGDGELPTREMTAVARLTP